MSTSQPPRTTFDNAYVALGEVFPGHPLMPAIRMVYLQGERFEKIDTGRQVWGPIRERQKRIRPVDENQEMFWNSFSMYMKLSVKGYLSWTRELIKLFFQSIVRAAHQQKVLVKTMNRFKDALARDLRYFRLDDQAKALDQATITDSGNPGQTMLDTMVRFTNTQFDDGKTINEGFALAKRLCNPYRPLLLKRLCDHIKGDTFLKYLDESRESAKIASKYRFFFRANEFTTEWDQIVGENLDGQGWTLGNKWLESQYGLAFMGEVARTLEGGGDHKADVGFICELFFYQNYDDWLEIFLEELVRKDASAAGDHPQIEVIQNNPRHFFNYGHFKRTQRLSTFMAPVLGKLNEEIAKWPNAGILAKEVLDVLGESRVGSGSAPAPRHTLAEKLKKKHAAKQPKVGLQYAQAVEQYARMETV